MQQDHVEAYHKNIARLQEKLVPMGGFYWQMIKGRGPAVRPTPAHHTKPAHNVTTGQCIGILRQYCTAEPSAWKFAQIYELQPTDPLIGEQATAEFLLSRGEYAWLGYGWVGCSSVVRPRPKEWDVDYGGEPAGPCSETGANTGVFTRNYPRATVQWDCHAGTGSITMK